MHGGVDYVLIMEGTRIAIQNMTCKQSWLRLFISAAYSDRRLKGRGNKDSKLQLQTSLLSLKDSVLWGAFTRSGVVSFPVARLCLLHI